MDYLALKAKFSILTAGKDKDRNSSHRSAVADGQDGSRLREYAERSHEPPSRVAFSCAEGQELDARDTRQKGALGAGPRRPKPRCHRCDIAGAEVSFTASGRTHCKAMYACSNSAS